jgi:hypothetical protein
MCAKILKSKEQDQRMLLEGQTSTATGTFSVQAYSVSYFLPFWHRADRRSTLVGGERIRALWTEHMSKEAADQWTWDLTSLFAGSRTGSLSDNEPLRSDELPSTIDSLVWYKADCRYRGRPCSRPAGTTSKYTWYKRGLNYLFMVYLITYLANVAGITNSLTNGRSRICGVIRGRSNRFTSSPFRSHWSWDPPCFVLDEYWQIYLWR